MPEPLAIADVHYISARLVLRLRIGIRNALRAGLALAISIAGAAQPASAFFFDYEKPQPPVGGDCAAIAAALGPAATWYGEFAGNYYDDFADRRYPFSARGCFTNEFDCRAWQNDAISYTGRGGIVYMRCTQGLRDSY